MQIGGFVYRISTDDNTIYIYGYRVIPCIPRCIRIDNVRWIEEVPILNLDRY